MTDAGTLVREAMALANAGEDQAAQQRVQPIQQRAVSGFPVWGTCAGAILLAKTS